MNRLKAFIMNTAEKLISKMENLPVLVYLLAPVICIILAAVIDEFTYDANNKVLCALAGAICIVLAVISIWSVLVIYDSKVVRSIGIVFGAIIILNSGTNISRLNHQSIPNAPLPNNPGTPYIIDVKGDDIDNDTYVDIDDPVKVTCNLCGGDGKCSSCDGTGWTSQRKDTINLGAGSRSYEERQTCHLCEGNGKCYKCHGTGYRTI